MLPTFLVIGAMRAGTTTLYEHLRRHPEVFMPALKEPNFFGQNWGRGTEWYESLFAASKAALARGEASTAYTDAGSRPGIAGRIAATIPDVRLIYLIRHPVDRLISQYHYEVTNRHTRKTLDQAVLLDRFLTRSMYAFQIEHYLKHFPREQLLILTTDELSNRPRETLARGYRFIGVDPDWQPVDPARAFHQREGIRPHRRPVEALRASPLRRLWVRAVPTPVRLRMRWLTTRKHRADPRKLELTPATRKELVERLTPDLIRLRGIMGSDFHCWGLLEDPSAATDAVPNTAP